MKQQERKEDAASPVIGVMLMVVVTIVIAAVITVFATGLGGDSTSTTPMALLEADNQQMNGDRLHSFDIVHKGGDKISTENIQVVIEPSGTDSSYGIIQIHTGNDLKVYNGETTVSTGGRFTVTMTTTSDSAKIYSDNLVKWTVSDTRTNGVIAKGEFIVP